MADDKDSIPQEGRTKPLTFEDEFMAHIVLPNQQTVGDWMRPQIEEAYQTGQLPPMLPALGPGK